MVHTRSEKDPPGAGQSWEVAAATAVPMGPAASQPRPAPSACRVSAVPGGTPRGSWATSRGPGLLTHNKQMCHNSLKPLFVKSIKIAQLRYSSSWPAWFLEGSSCVLALSSSETWDLHHPLCLSSKSPSWPLLPLAVSNSPLTPKFRSNSLSWGKQPCSEDL